MSDVPAETQEKINKLQIMEQSMQNYLGQKQQFQSQLLEIESALSELEKTNQAYKIVGNIMVVAEKSKLTEELTTKKETTELRIKTLEKQEAKLREKTSEIQKEVMKEMK
ncbi:prefoldin subunit beta [Candidatus Woesearchaeota archaeon]|jgi:prefoldin beta subunit|nr:prefoldin subunit beta [Candidatus Woesearchaeota archaeon]